MRTTISQLPNWESFASDPARSNIASGEIYYYDLADGYIGSSLENQHITVWPQYPTGCLPLTVSEQLSATASGATIAELAASLGLEESSILYSLHRARSVLGATTTPQAVRRGMRLGTVEPFIVNPQHTRRMRRLTPEHLDALWLVANGITAKQAAWLRYTTAGHENKLRYETKDFLQAKHLAHAIGILCSLNAFGDDLEDYDIPTLPSDAADPPLYYIDTLGPES